MGMSWLSPSSTASGAMPWMSLSTLAGFDAVGIKVHCPALGGQRGGIALASACDRVVRHSAVASVPYSQLNAQGLEDSENRGKLRIAGR